VLVQAVVKNQGDLATLNGFYTDLYADHLPTGAGDYNGSIRFWVNDPITAGATITLTAVMTDTAGLAGAAADSINATTETAATLYAQVDSTGAISEPDKQNNIYEVVRQFVLPTRMLTRTMEAQEQPRRWLSSNLRLATWTAQATRTGSSSAPRVKKSTCCVTYDLAPRPIPTCTSTTLMALPC